MIKKRKFMPEKMIFRVTSSLIYNYFNFLEASKLRYQFRKLKNIIFITFGEIKIFGQKWKNQK